MITLTQEQQNVHDCVVDWVKAFYRNPSKKQWLSVAGLAGTGKTTLVKFIADTIKNDDTLWHSIAYVTYTGKASVVLKSKMPDLPEEDYIGTIHSLIYQPIIDENQNIIGWRLKPKIEYSLIVVDEGSMVNKDLWNDLLTYGKPIIVVGDHGQLPPIGNVNFSLMKKPDLLLKKIHRQALENPIIKVSLFARKYGYVPTKIFGKEIAKFDWVNTPSQNAINKYRIDNEDTQILCGMNATRVKINEIIRENNGIDREEPIKGEKLICLVNNKKDSVMNGQMGILQKISLFSDHLYEFDILMDGDDWSKDLYSYTGGFGQVKYDVAMEDLNKPIVRNQTPQGRKVNLFDFGYAISVHKSQGSEWDKVILFEERNFFQSDEDYARWLYTGITRAKNKIIIIKNF